jgi:hypothetical protein
VIAPQITGLIVADRIADRQRHAAAARLAAIARCCRPSTWARTARRIRAASARATSVLRHRAPEPCCAPA